MTALLEKQVGDNVNATPADQSKSSETTCLHTLPTVRLQDVLDNGGRLRFRCPECNQVLQWFVPNNGEGSVRFLSVDLRGVSANGHANGSQKKTPDPSLAKSKLNRSGLNAGAVAPEWTLPHLGGDDVSLADFRGKRVLLVFSDPNCGPCDAIAPRLQVLHLTRTDIQVVVISRKDAAAVRAKADKFGLTYPIVMQKQWEISLLYGMFATPIGYLIDENGILLSGVAVGADPIMALVESASQ